MGQLWVFYVRGPDAPEARIHAFKQEVRRRPIAGDVYTQASGIEDEDNRLVQAATGALFVPEGLLAMDGQD
jgi:hypothetical protein